jgi:hypothetical protein
LLPNKEKFVSGNASFATPKLNKNDSKKLTDCTHGLPVDYHSGWFIFPGEDVPSTAG